jgi:hypothetical protein
MIVTYFRSSSFNNWDFCEQQYYLKYVLGLPDVSGKKAEMGTIVHKVMEILAVAKEGHQNGVYTFTDDALGDFTFSEQELFDDAWMDYLLTLSYDYYAGKSVHKWTKGDKKKCLQWCYTAVTELNCCFDPRKRKIIAAEPHFDFVLPYEWAKFEYEINGEKIEGQLAMKGTIDMVTEERPGILESVDWKTGKCMNWATGETKGYNCFTKDPQLRIYHYALHKLFPEVEQFIPTIYWINDGGAYTMPYGPKDIKATEEMLRRRFQEIKRSTKPSLIANTRQRWKCKTLCGFGKTQHPSGEINPYTGDPHTICSMVAAKIKRQGIERTTIEEKAPGHEFNKYQAPGA